MRRLGIGHYVVEGNGQDWHVVGLQDAIGIMLRLMGDEGRGQMARAGLYGGDPAHGQEPAGEEDGTQKTEDVCA